MVQIDTNVVFKNLKKHNGEAVAKLIRDNQLLDIPNIEHILEFAGNNPEDIKKLVPVLRSQYKIISASVYDTELEPLELLKRAGYDAFVVTNLEQQNSIKKYFRPDEELCTFRDKNRYKNNYMIHAVKLGADEIKPSETPERQDEYGTSVISIQIPKTGGTISIKNRYNHTVNNPDATFNNNPDNIIIGLTNSLQKFFGVQFNVSLVELPDNYRLVEDQLVKYNYEIYNIYFGPNYYFTGDKITKINTGYQVMMDCLILDEKEKEITSPIHDDTYDVFCKAFNGKAITRTTEKNEIIVTTNDGNRAVIKDGIIIELGLPHIKEIGDGFLDSNEQLTSLNLPNVETIGLDFLSYNEQLTSLKLPKVESIGDYFLERNKQLKSLNLPNVKTIGHDFLRENTQLTSLELPKAESIGGYFLGENKQLKSLNLPNVKTIGHDFLRENTRLISLNLPKVKEIDYNFLSENTRLISLNLPNVEIIGYNFLSYNKQLNSINLPKVKEIGSCFLRGNTQLTSLNLPNVKKISYDFLSKNEQLTSLSLPKVKIIWTTTPDQIPILDRFLECNNSLTTVNLPEKYKDLAKTLLTRNSKIKKIKNAIKQVTKRLQKLTNKQITEIKER
ncbi:MAG: leucine-rich repeat protein [Alphaproteobacteria bacterium]|nr:leucine-rich repeat protein [Alphaproteobacteria bacterium]